MIIGTMLGLGTDTSTAAETVRARYSLRYMGIHVGEVSTVSTVGKSRYQAELHMQVAGIAALASSFQASMKSSGTVRGESVLPSAFNATETSRNVETSTYQVLFDAGNVSKIDLKPPVRDAEERVPLAEDQKRNVVDPSSAPIMLVPNGEATVGPAACNRTLRVFNGSFRTDISLAFSRTEEMETRNYRGPVSVCSLRYTPIAGHKPAAIITQFMTANEDMEVRVAPAMTWPMAILVSATIPLPFGTATIALEQLELTSKVDIIYGKIHP